MPHRVLIVDDMQVNRKLMQALLEKSLDNLEIHQAEDGFQALKLLETLEIDLIILDLMMPEMDGFQFMQAIKAEPAWQDIPVIINSGLSDLEYIEHALGEGALDYFTKPLSPAQMKIVLPLKVKNALAFYEQKKELARWKRKLSEEIRIAGVLQNSLLVKEQEFRAAFLLGRYMPSLDIGGDFYDACQVGDSLWFMIADVTGNGVAAALVASMLKILFAGVCQKAQTPAEVLTELNRTFLEMFPPENPVIFSAFIGLLQERRLTFANAGHPYPLLLRPGYLIPEIIEQDGHLVGAVADGEFSNRAMQLAAGETLVLYTDGLFTTGVIRNWIDLCRLIAVKYPEAAANPAQLPERLIVDLQNGRELEDDCALLIVNIK